MRHLVFLCLVIFCGHVHGQEEPKKFTADGYLKFFQTAFVFEVPDGQGGTSQSLLADNLFHHRLNLAYYPVEGLSVHAGMRNRLSYGALANLIPNYGEQLDNFNGFVDLSILWVDNSSLVLHTIFDRAYVNYSKGNWDVRVGRQRINWGRTLVWNPNDLFNAFNFLDFDYEERPGADAVRIQYNFGVASGIETAYSPAKESENSIGALMYKGNVKGYDFQAMLGYFAGDIAVGGGWEGYLKDAGFKGEITYFIPVESVLPDGESSVSVSATVDNLWGDFYGSAGLLFNSNGQARNINGGGVVSNFNQNVSAKNLYPGIWVWFGQGSYTINPLMSINLSVIYSAQNLETIFFPTFTYSITENWDFDIGTQTFFADTEGYEHNGSSVFWRIKFSY